jgi:hypothetical protein
MEKTSCDVQLPRDWRLRKFWPVRFEAIGLTQSEFGTPRRTHFYMQG